jgi:hypothetical protein
VSGKRNGVLYAPEKQIRRARGVKGGKIFRKGREANKLLIPVQAYNLNLWQRPVGHRDVGSNATLNGQ